MKVALSGEEEKPGRDGLVDRALGTVAWHSRTTPGRRCQSDTLWYFFYSLPRGWPIGGHVDCRPAAFCEL